ncbi:6-phosphofructokinase, partial [candidate division KSB1 bacterium]
MEKIGILTSGGDAPGMNACIRSVVRTAIANNIAVVGIQRGYQGLLEKDFIEMGPRSVSNIIQRGGTILKTSRCEDFKKWDGREKAVNNLKGVNVEGMVVIGGDGTFHGAKKLSEEWGINIIGVPGTIDNDIYGTDLTIGFDTAVNTALEAVDKIRDTAGSHDRQFIVEVMGRHAGFIALEVGMSCGAEEILIPERRTDIKKIAQRIMEGRISGKTSYIIIVAEGDEEGDAFEISHKLNRITGLEYKICVLGHIQRGGAPTATDRILGTELGIWAVENLLKGETGKMIGEVDRKPLLTPFEDT